MIKLTDPVFPFRTVLFFHVFVFPTTVDKYYQVLSVEYQIAWMKGSLEDTDASRQRRCLRGVVALMNAGRPTRRHVLSLTVCRVVGDVDSIGQRHSPWSQRQSPLSDSVSSYLSILTDFLDGLRLSPRLFCDAVELRRSSLILKNALQRYTQRSFAGRFHLIVYGYVTFMVFAVWRKTLSALMLNYLKLCRHAGNLVD